jgi:hypothetical protein
VLMALLPDFVKPPPPVEDDDELVHRTCCDDTLSWCGLDLAGADDIDDPEPAEMCVVCLDLERNAEFCGPGCPGVVPYDEELRDCGD